jgi:hypothetical protein
MKPHKAGLKWSMMKFHAEELSLVSDLLLTPKQYGKEEVSHGLFVYKNKLTAVTVDNSITYPTTQYDKGAQLAAHPAVALHQTRRTAA